MQKNVPPVVSGILKLLVDIGTVKTFIIRGNANLTLSNTGGSLSSLADSGAYTKLSVAAAGVISFSTYRQNSTTPIATNQTNIPIAQYDNAGTLTNLGTNNEVAAHRLYVNIISSEFAFMYGQKVYTNLAGARTTYFDEGENFIVPSILRTNYVHIATILSQRNTANFSLNTTSDIKNTSKFCDQL